MDHVNLWPWFGLLFLGGLHGVNPAMGWLFAVGLGLQRDSRRAVWGALGPLALGHLLAIAVALLVAAVAGVVVPARELRWAVAGALLAMGLLQLRGHRHVARGGMRVGRKDLTIWSFLMASAHGAGLMALPLVMGASRWGGASPASDTAHGSPAAHLGHGDHAHHAAEAALAAPVLEGGHAGHSLLVAGLPSGEVAALLATLVHTVGYLAVTGVVAVVVYEKVGLRMLRSAWINLDALWTLALIATALLTLLI